MVTNRRRPILKIIEDSAGGTHDTLLAACDRYRYELLGCKDYHRNCTDNFWEAMVAAGYKPVELPAPFNLWQNTPVEPDGRIKPNPPVTKKGDYIVLRAEMDLVICLSACPQDITDVVKLFDTPQLSGILHFQTLFFIIVRADITQRRM